MNIQELENKHHDIVINPLCYKNTNPVEHTKLSIQLAIEMLEELNLIEVNGCGCGEANIFYKEFENKIEELKKYL